MRFLVLMGVLASQLAHARGVLPAGVYFRHHTYSTCPDCTAPAAAVITGVYADVRAAELAVRRVPAARLAVGYPLVVHTEELGLADASADGIVVVAGLFASDGDALRFLDEVRGELPDARVAPLAANQGSPRKLVVRIAAGAPVPAFARAEVDEEADRPRRVLDTRRDPRTHASPLCAVQPGALFVATDEELRHYYEWAPVRCAGGEPAYVRWQATLLHSTIRHTAGGYRLRQVTGAECDEPSFGEWRYDPARGRLPLAHKP